MAVTATIDWAASLPIIIGIIGLAGVIFTALRFGRDDTTQVVNQQTAITQEMKVLTDELRLQRDECRTERQRLTAELERLTRG